MGTDSVYQRFSRCADRGIREQMRHRFAGDPDPERLIIDSTVAQPAHAPPERSESRGLEDRAPGRSRGGFRRQAPRERREVLGNTLRFILAGGQDHDITQSP
jgi:hypothetical protein